MKKVHLYTASVLLSGLLASGLAQAATPVATTPAQGAGKETTASDQAVKSPLAEKMKLVHDAMMKVHEANKPLLDKMKAAQKELADIAKAPTFDKAAYLAKHAELQEMHAKLSAARAEALADVAAQMTAGERASLPMLSGAPSMRGPMMKRDGTGPHGMMKGPAAAEPSEPAKED